MDSKELKRILAGLSLGTLLAGSGFVGISYTHAGQGGWGGSTRSGGTEQKAAEEKATGQGSVERGKMLFDDASLGGSTNEKSCNSCHPGGQGLEKSGEIIAEMVNKCIEGPLAGKALDTESQEMKDLISYIRSLEK